MWTECSAGQFGLEMVEERLLKRPLTVAWVTSDPGAMLLARRTGRSSGRSFCGCFRDHCLGT